MLLEQEKPGSSEEKVKGYHISISAPMPLSLTAFAKIWEGVAPSGSVARYMERVSVPCTVHCVL